MSFRFCSFASGSSGNSYLVRSENTNIIVDAGIAGKRIFAGLSDNGLSPEEVDAVLVTHEHSDHVKSLRIVGKKACNAKIIGSNGTLNQVKDKLPEGRAFRFPDSRKINIGDICVRSFSLSHDAAEPLGYSLSHDGRKVVIVTDTGYVTEDIFEEIVTSDLIVLESNYEKNILQMGSYPYALKLRILGEEGHLSNEDCGRCLCRMLQERDRTGIPKVLLAHLSKENNTPDQAFLTVRNILFEEDFYIGKDIRVSVASRDDAGPVIEV